MVQWSVFNAIQELTSRPLNKLNWAARAGVAWSWAMIEATLAGSAVWAATRRAVPNKKVVIAVANLIGESLDGGRCCRETEEGGKGLEEGG